MWWLAPTMLVAAWIIWGSVDAAPQVAAAVVTSSAIPPEGAKASATSTPAAAAPAVPFSASGIQARQDQRAVWQQRLERAKEALQAYDRSTRYPFESQPASDHVDQMRPNDPVVEDHALRQQDGKAADGVRLRTTQERIFVQGNESVKFTVSVVDRNGMALPLRVVRANAHEVPAPNTASLFPDVPMNFNDDGMAGDLVPSDKIYSAQLQPAQQGFGGLFGQIRVELALQYGGQQGFTYFDVMYTPEPPATWSGGVREAMEDGSLNLYLKANVKEAGRYVITGRIDDANGKPFALLTFNDEVAAGSQDIKLTVFGKLVRDAKPAFPLTLRDVDGFLLRPDAFPDRRLMPRIAGVVHTSKSYPLTSFSDTSWTSEERQRYLTELNKDLSNAQDHVDQLGKGP
ncbi:hypothetical protein DZC73_16050 [Albitalea terrae]|uniref:Uncharacterized protein n=2 Tax=Piscinibacter terrae TaxID=2496871 RepID=A0A3N7HPL8_9BURK|nr:hypothetical protein DZC73_16050 [Albitalea terrae]